MRGLVLVLALLAFGSAYATEAKSKSKQWSNEDISVSSRYVPSKKPRDTTPIPSDFYDIPRDVDSVDNIPVSIDDICPDHVSKIPNYDPDAVVPAEHQ